MTTNSLHPNKAIEQILNEQLNKEHRASLTYLRMAMWAELQGYPRAAAFLYKQSAEEREHMLKIVHYLTKAGKHPCIAMQPAVETTYTSLRELFEEVLQNEMQLTQAVHQLADRCLAEKDFATFQFLQWFVEEQREEENKARSILDLFSVIEKEGYGHYGIDLAIGTIRREK